MKRLLSIFRSRRLDHDLDDEIASHLAMQEEEFRKAGMSPGQARAAARREFGGLAQTKERYRDQRGVPVVENLVRDFLYAVRGLRQSRGFTAAAILSLALGIGANCAIFTLFRAFLMRNLPVFHPEELVSLYRTGGWGRGYSSYPLYLEIRKRTDLFQDVIARSAVEKVKTPDGQPIQREFVTPNYFGTLGIGAAIGRVIADDDRAVAVLSFDHWQRRFGGDPSVVGQKIVAGEQPLTIVGVAQAGFRGIDIDRHTDLWLPVKMKDGNIMHPGMNWAWMVGRRKPGVSRAQIQAAIDVLFRQYLAGVYGEKTPPQFRKVALAQQIEVRAGGIGLSGVRDQFQTGLVVLMAAVGLVLLAACANVANLLLERGAARQKEMALRVALGASRGRLVQQALVESFLLATIGAAAGFLLAQWGTRGILAFLPEPVVLEPDAGVLWFTAAIAAGAAALFGVGPALHSATADPAAGLRMRGRRALVAMQVAFSVVLVAVAGLFGHSIAELRSVNLGFTTQNVVAFPSPPRRDDTIRRLEQMPGVTGVSFGVPGPFLSGSASGTLRIHGVETGREEYTAMHLAGPGYFDVIGPKMAAGRGIEKGDTANARQVAVVNEAFVRRYFGGESRVLDRVIEAADSVPRVIVGIVRDMAHDGLREKAAPTVYLPGLQARPGWAPIIVARGTVTAAAIRRELGLDSDPWPLWKSIDQSIFQDRMLATVGTVFGVLALTLAAVGLYGVVAYGTTRRAREIGIRIALGAGRPGVVWLVVRDALALVVAGLAVGLPASYAAARPVAALLFGVKPLDAASIGITTGALLLVGLGAALIPARRAARLEPMSVLRHN